MPDWDKPIIDEFRANVGKVGGRFEGKTLLLLHSTGAKRIGLASVSRGEPDLNNPFPRRGPPTTTGKCIPQAVFDESPEPPKSGRSVARQGLGLNAEIVTFRWQGSRLRRRCG